LPGLYVHVPFCARACPYCDFDFEVGRSPDLERFLAGLERELDGRLAERTGPRGQVEARAATRSLPILTGPEGHVQTDMSSEPGPKRAAMPPGEAWPTVYLGGGTPSLLGPEGLRALGGWISGRFPGAGAEEYTVEVNPEHACPALYAAIRAMGGTRVSLGVQSFDAEGLRALGRGHEPGQARAAVVGAREAGLDLSVDLIVGYPGQSAASLAVDLAELTTLGASHVSVYALTVESGTPWEALVRRGKRVLPDADHQADMLLATESALVAAGLEHYEVASYAAPGHKARHNLGYWTWRDYLGLGPSAHSAVYAGDGSLVRRGNRRGLAAWAADPVSPAELDIQDPVAAASEGLWTGIRHLPGLDVERFLARFPAVDRAWIEARTRRQVALGNLAFAGRLLRVAPGRWLWHDAIAADLLG
jgi:oxygen-independent coproporphyrinogen-3 oxidase